MASLGTKRFEGRVFGRCVDAATKVLLKNGFTLENHVQRAMIKYGVEQDVPVLAYLAPGWVTDPNPPIPTPPPASAPSSPMSPTSPARPKVDPSRVTFRRWTLDDVPAIVTYADTLDMGAFNSNRWDPPFTIEKAEATIHTHLKLYATREAVFPSEDFAVCLDGEVVGHAHLAMGEGLKLHTGIVGWGVSDRVKGQGVGTIAAQKLIDLARSRSWRRLTAWIWASNAPSHVIAKRLGFQPDYTSRGFVVKDLPMQQRKGVVIDVICYSFFL